MKILVTGGAGFIGSHFIRYMLGSHRDVSIVNYDVLTYAGNLENLKDVEKDPRYVFLRGDITNRAQVDAAVRGAGLDAIVNFAAESHVDRSLHVGVEEFIRTNVLGTQILVDTALDCKVPRFLQISTDEVYGSLGPDGRFTEKTPVLPNNPYSATKAAADFLVRAACRSHGLNAVTTRCSNNYGPFQFPEKLIPLMIANALEDKPLPVYGDGLQVRDWIHALDHSSAVDLVLRHGKSGSVYNIGSMNDIPNLLVVKTLLKILGKPESLITYVKDRPGHDRRYAMDATVIQNELGWKPTIDFEQGLRDTVAWYLANREWLDHVRSGAYRDYYSKLYGNR